MKRLWLTRGLISVAILAAILPHTVKSGESGISESLQFSLYCKAMTFDRNLETRCGDTIVFAILYQERYQASVIAQENLLDAFKASNISHIKNTPLQMVSFNIDKDNWQQKLYDANVDVIYLAPTRSFDIGRVLEYSQEHKSLTLSSDPESVSAGVALGIRLAENRPKFVINLTSCKSEGVDFSSQLLGLADVFE